MADLYTITREIFGSIPVRGWAAIVGLIAALLAALVSLWNTRKTLDVLRRSLDVQRLTNARAVSTFIADKRQKWIDDLRNDVSKYLALSLETAEAWKQVYWKCGNEYDANSDRDPLGTLKACESTRVEFLGANALRDSEHHQLYMRILLRLNNDEKAHQDLTVTLGGLRAHMRDLAVAALKGSYSNQKLLDTIAEDLSLAAESTKAILKEEWQRLKCEVADPDKLIFEILSASTSKSLASSGAVSVPRFSVASSLSQKSPITNNAKA
jgi:hypothetical protein